MSTTDFGNILPRIERINGKKLVGKCLTMSFAQNKTGELWKSFMPRRQEISNSMSNDLISLQVYDPGCFLAFGHEVEFKKWAAVEVFDFGNVPIGMEIFKLDSGLYAVFDYVGMSCDSSIFTYIFGKWLPNSAYELDNRPHFEVLGDKYKNNDPNSEEEIWVPISLKQK